MAPSKTPVAPRGAAQAPRAPVPGARAAAVRRRSATPGAALGRAALPCAALVVFAAALGCDPGPVPRAMLGESLYDNCSSCHGARGEGNQLYHAPAIAGHDRWYLEAQLHKFKEGARGDHPDDLTGLRMRPMARMLRTDEEISAVAAYVASLQPTRPAATLEGGDAEHGRELYGTCVACHGDAGQGSRAVNAPRLAGASDWYLAAQLEKFRAGTRGADPEDTTGAQMRPMASGLADAQAIKDVVAHIMTLAAN